MADTEELEKRSREIADTTRRLLIALNTGGVAVTFGVAGSLAAQGVNPSWAVAPVSVFVLGLIGSAISLFMAKYKAIKRRDAARDEQPEPDFKKIRYRNSTYEVITLVIFIAAVFVGLKQIQHVVVKQKATPTKEERIKNKNTPAQVEIQKQKAIPNQVDVLKNQTNQAQVEIQKQKESPTQVEELKQKPHNKPIKSTPKSGTTDG